MRILLFNLSCFTCDFPSKRLTSYCSESNYFTDPDLFSLVTASNYCKNNFVPQLCIPKYLCFFRNLLFAIPTPGHPDNRTKTQEHKARWLWNCGQTATTSRNGCLPVNC